MSTGMETVNTMTISQTETASPRLSLVERLARFFHTQPNVWLDGVRDLGRVAGVYAWRSRCSELRRFPFNMRIENRQRRIRRPDGTTYTISEYRFIPEERTAEGAADGAGTSSAAV